MNRFSNKSGNYQQEPPLKLVREGGRYGLLGIEEENWKEHYRKIFKNFLLERKGTPLNLNVTRKDSSNDVRSDKQKNVILSLLAPFTGGVQVYFSNTIDSLQKIVSIKYK